MARGDLPETRIEEWTDPSAESPEKDPDLAIVADLVRRSRPENGVDLAPWWRERLATEAVTVHATRKPRLAMPWARYAAVFVIGGALGAGAVSIGELRPTPSPHYSAGERALMCQFLGEAGPLADRLRARASAELVGCVACHRSALEDKLGQRLTD